MSKTMVKTLRCLKYILPLVLCSFNIKFSVAQDWTPPRARCPSTPFNCDVENAINLGLQYTRTLMRGDYLVNGRHNFFGILSLLEKRQGIGWNGPALGYNGSEPDDQEIVRNLVRGQMTAYTSHSNASIVPYNYSVGGGLMGLSVYLASGGPEEVGANVTVTQGLANAVNAVRNARSTALPNGGWMYTSPASSSDLSVTQFAIAGLSAAQNLIPEASDEFPEFINFMVDSQSNDGGFSYRVSGRGGNIGHSTMSATGLWCLRLTQVPIEDDSTQDALQWLRTNYRYDSVVRSNSHFTYYYIWAAAKSLKVSDAYLSPDLLTGYDFGDRNPVESGYPEERPSHYFDFAYTLLSWQDQETGRWGYGDNGTPSNNSEVAGHHFAILTLERSLGGACVDVDNDQLCGLEDNCPDIPNPDQLDEDQDGIGDACDNCPKVINRAQEDTDGDALGDACDRYLCIPDGQVEVCDSVDNDCDNLIDQNLDGSPVVPPDTCDTGLVGACALGVSSCSDLGQVVCLPERGLIDESCDGEDNDCDGMIDEGVRNRCGFCGEELEELCDGEDNDCDGRADEGGDLLCPEGLLCTLGECGPPCRRDVPAGYECPSTYFCQQNTCVSLCAGISCEEGQECVPETGSCRDVCFGVECAEGEVCVGGECLIDSCEYAGCPEGTRCELGYCLDDPCADLECGEDSFCREGECVFSCADISCGFGEHCVDGECASARCSGLVCADGQVCMEGICEPDPCTESSCEDFEACVLGDCVPDPCRYIDCPELERCELVYGVAQCVADWVGQMSEDPAEVNTTFDFREPPIVTPEGGEEGAGEEMDGGTEAMGGGEAGDESGTMAREGAEEKSGCDQNNISHHRRGRTLPMTIVFLLLTLAAIRRTKARLSV